MNIALPAFLILCFSALPLQAAGVGVLAGRTDTADFGTGKTYGLKVEADLLPLLAIELRGSHSRDFDLDSPDVSDFMLYSLEAGLRARLPLGPFLGLYGAVGCGYHVMPKFDMILDDGRVLSSDIEDAPGGYALAGIDAGIANVRLFAEGQYRLLRPKLVKTDFLPETYTPINTDLSGLALHIGILIRW